LLRRRTQCFWSVLLHLPSTSALIGLCSFLGHNRRSSSNLCPVSLFYISWIDMNSDLDSMYKVQSHIGPGCPQI
jgi:hypothetical protein